MECVADGQEVGVDGYEGTLTCPPYNVVCGVEASCPSSCSGRGVCRDDGTCECATPGYQGADCSEQVKMGLCVCVGGCIKKIKRDLTLATRPGWKWLLA